jgi:hypothetical protein
MNKRLKFLTSVHAMAGMTKTIVHPRAVDNSRIVRMDVLYSMWRNRTIPCPDGSGRPACETILLHREDFKIPENLARFAVRHGMTSFVKKMASGVRGFIDERRARVDMVSALCVTPNLGEDVGCAEL